MEVMFAFIERLVNIVRPRKLLYIGIGTTCLPGTAARLAARLTTSWWVRQQMAWLLGPR